MRVEELIFSQREFLKELHALCKKWNVKIGGCGCCGSPWVTFSDDTIFNDVYVTPDMLSASTPDGDVYIRDRYHDINVTCEDVDMDGDGQYICQRVTASCSKCGLSVTRTVRGREEAERLAVSELEKIECK